MLLVAALGAVWLGLVAYGLLAELLARRVHRRERSAAHDTPSRTSWQYVGGRHPELVLEEDVVDRGQWVWQPPPQQPPAPWGVGGGPAVPGVARPPIETRLSSFTVSVWPSGQAAGAEASAMGRSTSKVDPHERHRKS